MRKLGLVLLFLVVVIGMVYSKPRIGSLEVIMENNRKFKSLAEHEIELKVPSGDVCAVILDTCLGLSVDSINGISADEVMFNRFFIKINASRESYDLSLKISLREDNLTKPIVAIYPGKWTYLKTPISVKARSSHELVFSGEDVYCVKLKLTVLTKDFNLEFNGSPLTLVSREEVKIEINGVPISGIELTLVAYGNKLSMINRGRDVIIILAYRKYFYREVSEGDLLENCFILYDSRVVDLKLSGVFSESPDPLLEVASPPPIKCLNVTRVTVDELRRKSRYIELRAVNRLSEIVEEAIIEVHSGQKVFRIKGSGLVKVRDDLCLVKVYLFGTLIGEYIVSTAAHIVEIPLDLYEVELEIKDSGLRPIDGAEVQLYSYSSLVLKRATAENGQVIFRNIPRGVYLVKVIYGGEEIGKKSIEVEHSVRDIVICDLADLVLYLKDTANHPLENMEVEVYGKSSQLVASGCTNGSGAFVAKCMPLGKYTVVVRYLCKNYTFTVFHKGTAIELEIPLKSMKIIVFDILSNTVSGAKIELYASKAKIAEKVLDSKGVALFTKIPEGEYTIKVHCIGGVEEKPIKLVSESAVIVVYLDALNVAGKPVKTELVKLFLMSIGVVLALTLVMKLKLAVRRKRIRKIIIVEE